MDETNFTEDSQNTHQSEEFMSQKWKILETLTNNFKTYIFKNLKEMKNIGLRTRDYEGRYRYESNISRFEKCIN